MDTTRFLRQDNAQLERLLRQRNAELNGILSLDLRQMRNILQRLTDNKTSLYRRITRGFIENKLLEGQDKTEVFLKPHLQELKKVSKDLFSQIANKFSSFFGDSEETLKERLFGEFWWSAEKELVAGFLYEEHPDKSLLSYHARFCRFPFLSYKGFSEFHEKFSAYMANNLLRSEEDPRLNNLPAEIFKDHVGTRREAFCAHLQYHISSSIELKASLQVLFDAYTPHENPYERSNLHKLLSEMRDLKSNDNISDELQSWLNLNDEEITERLNRFDEFKKTNEQIENLTQFMYLADKKMHPYLEGILNLNLEQMTNVADYLTNRKTIIYRKIVCNFIEQKSLKEWKKLQVFFEPYRQELKRLSKDLSSQIINKFSNFFGYPKEIFEHKLFSEFYVEIQKKLLNGLTHESSLSFHEGFCINMTFGFFDINELLDFFVKEEGEKLLNELPSEIFKDYVGTRREAFCAYIQHSISSNIELKASLQVLFDAYISCKKHNLSKFLVEMHALNPKKSIPDELQAWITLNKDEIMEKLNESAEFTEINEQIENLTELMGFVGKKIYPEFEGRKEQSIQTTLELTDEATSHESETKKRRHSIS